MIRKLLDIFLSEQFLRFIIVGVTAVVANWLSRYAFGWVMSFSLAVFCAYFVGMATAFVLNAIYVFPTSARPRHLQARDFVAINIAFLPVVWGLSIAFNVGLLRLGLEEAYSEPLAHALALGMPMLINFLLYKFVAFRDVGES